MSSIITAVFKATIGLLVNKSRDKAAEKLKDGDVTDQQFRTLIVREIDDIKSKLDGLSRKDLLASISFFEEGIELLYEVFGEARSRSEDRATQEVSAEAFSVAERMGELELTGLGESAMAKLSIAKERFKDARRKATEAFKNEALATSDRILAVQYRVMATILETVDNPANAVAPCRVCVKELNCLPAVQNSFDVQLKTGIQAVWGLLSKEARMKIISSVCHVNRVVYDFTLTVGKDVHLWIWPLVDIGENKVDLLRDERVTKVLRQYDMEHCYITPWSFGQGGEEEHKLKSPTCIATNSSGQFIVADGCDRNVKVFDSKGKFVKHFSIPTDDVTTMLYVSDVDTDMNDNIYVLAWLQKSVIFPRSSCWVYKFNKTADLHHTFLLRKHESYCGALSVSDRGEILVLEEKSVVRKYDAYHGQFVRSFGEGILQDAWDITVAQDGRVMVVNENVSSIDIFSEHGDYLNKFHLQRSYDEPTSIAFHWESGHVVVAGCEREKELLHLEIYTKDGAFVIRTQIHEKGIQSVTGITVTSAGRIAVLTRYVYVKYKVVVV